MSRRMIASITAALALAPLSAFAADKAPAHRHMDHDQNCSCSQVASSTATSPAPVTTYRGASKAELERIWASP